MERVGDRDEVSGLVRRVGIDRARGDLRLIRDDRDRLTAEPGQAAQDRAAEARLDLEPHAVVEEQIEHRTHVVDPAIVARHDLGDLVEEPRPVVASSRRRVRPRTRREVREVGAQLADGVDVVARDVVDEAARQGDVRPAEVLLGDVLAGRLANDRRARP